MKNLESFNNKINNPLKKELSGSLFSAEKQQKIVDGIKKTLNKFEEQDLSDIHEIDWNNIFNITFWRNEFSSETIAEESRNENYYKLFYLKKIAEKIPAEAIVKLFKNSVSQVIAENNGQEEQEQEFEDKIQIIKLAIKSLAGSIRFDGICLENEMNSPTHQEVNLGKILKN